MSTLIFLALVVLTVVIVASMTNAQRKRAKKNVKAVIDINKDGVLNKEDVKQAVKNVKKEAGRVKRKYGTRAKKATKTTNSQK
jgi:hypothetical protein